MPAYCGYQVHGVELAVVIIDELCAARYPLAVAFAPAALCPAGVRHGDMQPVVQHLVPVDRRYYVAKRIIEIVQHHFRHAGSAGGEKHKHRVVPARAHRRNKAFIAL